MRSTDRISNKRRQPAQLCKSPLCRKVHTSKSKPLPWRIKMSPLIKGPSVILRAKIDILMDEDLLALFRETGALLDGHFVLRSGLHSRQYFQCALLLQHTEIATRVCGWLADK